MTSSDYIPTDNELIEAHARVMLAHPLLGKLLRQAVGATDAGRRSRFAAMQGLLDVARLWPFSRPALARAAGIAWEERFAAEFGTIVGEPAGKTLEEMLAKLQQGGSP